MRLFALPLVFVLLGTCAPALIFGQMGTVNGRVALDNTPAEFTNIAPLNAADSTVLKLELVDAAGSFTFRELPAADYFIRTSGIGVPETSHPAFSLTEGQTLTLADYALSGGATDLETIEVTARKPFLEQKAGMLVVNVDQSITGQGGTVIDLLKKVPGVVIAGNRISMAGKSGLTILIDGRPTKYLDINSLLRDMPADNIKSIEVISQPGAAYDAEENGGAINIVLKKNSLLGTNGQVYIGGASTSAPSYRATAPWARRIATNCGRGQTMTSTTATGWASMGGIATGKLRHLPRSAARLQQPKLRCLLPDQTRQRAARPAARQWRAGNRYRPEQPLPLR